MLFRFDFTLASLFAAACCIRAYWHNFFLPAVLSYFSIEARTFRRLIFFCSQFIRLLNTFPLVSLLSVYVLVFFFAESHLIFFSLSLWRIPYLVRSTKCSYASFISWAMTRNWLNEHNAEVERLTDIIVVIVKAQTYLHRIKKRVHTLTASLWIFIQKSSATLFIPSARIVLRGIGAK